MNTLKDIIKNKSVVTTFCIIIIIITVGISYKVSIDKKYRYKISKNGMIITECIIDGDDDLKIPSYIWGRKVIGLGCYAFSAKGYSKIIIPNTVKIIENGCFSNSRDLEYVEGMENVNQVGDSAFYYCLNLKKFKCPNNLYELGEGAFEMCLSLEEVSINDMIKTIEYRTFCECMSLRKVTIGSGIDTIERNAFVDNYVLKSITIESDEVKMEDEAFFMCLNLEEIDIDGKISADNNSSPFSGCYKIYGKTYGDYTISDEY